MRRNIIFRGREPQSSVWRTGSLVTNAHAALIVNLGCHSIDAIQVDPDTVQQMTNCYHHRRVVWEGDVYADPARPDLRYTVYYDILRDEFRIALSHEVDKTRRSMSISLVYYLAEHDELEYVGNIADLTDNTDKP